jgi:hypothetical protein
MTRAATVLSIIALSACGPGITTGDRLSDIVVVREAGSSTPCVAFGDRTVIYAEDDDGPPGMLRARSFGNAEVRTAAERLQTRWDQVPEDSYQTIGTVDGDRCLMVVDRPAISGDIAFVGFSAPSGQIGAYAFRRGGGEWFVIERVVTGYW